MLASLSRAFPDGEGTGSALPFAGSEPRSSQVQRAAVCSRDTAELSQAAEPFRPEATAEFAMRGARFVPSSSAASFIVSEFGVETDLSPRPAQETDSCSNFKTNPRAHAYTGEWVGGWRCLASPSFLAPKPAP